MQHQGGCIAIVPGAGSGPATANIAAAAAPNRSIGRFPDVTGELPTPGAANRYSNPRAGR